MKSGIFTAFAAEPKDSMRVLSVCSGIGTDAVAWHPLGWEHLCFAEIQKFPSAVLKHRWPGIPNEGDFTKIGDKYRGAADLVVGGTPCQSFSIAGLRGGLADDRGNLALEFLKLADRTRPRWLVWENVPGVLSSVSHVAPDPRQPTAPMDVERDGQEVATEDEYTAEELHAFRCFLAGLSECGYGYAYRVLDAQYFGVPQRRRRIFVVGHFGDWRRAAAVLFERHCMQGRRAPGKEARQRVAGTITSGIGKRRGSGFDPGAAVGIEIGPSGGRFTDTHPTLDTRCKDGFIRNQLNGGVLAGGFFDQPQIVGSLCADSHPGSYSGQDAYTGRLIAHSLRADMAVRRLTPRECERLQGLPDDYTMIPFNGKPAADGPRYKAIGNGMAMPVLRWIGERIKAVEVSLSVRQANE